MTNEESKSLLVGEKVVSSSGTEYAVAYHGSDGFPILLQTRLNKSGRPYGKLMFMSKPERFTKV